MPNSYDQGDLVRAQVDFHHTASQSAVDPDVVQFRIKPPVGGASTYTHATHSALVKAAVGQYRFDIDCASPGQWHYRFVGTGTYQAAAERSLVVASSVF